MSRFNWAPTAFHFLKGVMCVFKPEGMSVHKVIRLIQSNLCKDLNALPCYQHEIPLRESSVTENANVMDVSVDTQSVAVEDWSEHRLVLGNRYEQTDFKIRFVDGISADSSGVLLLGIGSFGKESCTMLSHSKFLREFCRCHAENFFVDIHEIDLNSHPLLENGEVLGCYTFDDDDVIGHGNEGPLTKTKAMGLKMAYGVYHVKGRLGWATDNFTPLGHILERTSFKHVNRSKLEKVCAAAQANHMRQMYRLHGVNPDSQEAYKMAAEGLIRPAVRNSEPVLYGVRCIDFQPPDFTLEIHCINETCPYLRCLVHELAIKLKTTAVCTGIRRLRYGYFDVQRALLRQQWHLDQIVDNIDSNMDLLTPDKIFVGTQAERVKLISPRQSAGYLPEIQQAVGHGDDVDDFVLESGPSIRDESNADVSQRLFLEDDKIK